MKKELKPIPTAVIATLQVWADQLPELYVKELVTDAYADAHKLTRTVATERLQAVDHYERLKIAYRRGGWSACRTYKARAERRARKQAPLLPRLRERYAQTTALGSAVPVQLVPWHKRAWRWLSNLIGRQNPDERI